MKRWQTDFSIQPVCFKQIQKIQPEAVLDRETDMEKIKILISKPMVKIRTLTPCTSIICIIQERVRNNDKRKIVKIASDKQVLVSTTNIYSPTFYLQKKQAELQRQAMTVKQRGAGEHTALPGIPFHTNLTAKALNGNPLKSHCAHLLWIWQTVLFFL